jgi:hypothetical protein
MQIREIREAVELPLTHPEYYDEMGITPPKGKLLIFRSNILSFRCYSLRTTGYWKDFIGKFNAILV